MEGYTFPEKKRLKPAKYSQILSSAVSLPEKKISNREILEKGSLPFKEAIIEKSIGVKERHIADEGIGDSDLLAAAARECLKKAGVEVDQLSRLIVTKFIGDNLFPMTASIVQRKLGASKAFHAFDMEGGTSSFVQALDLADKYISTGDEYVLILSGGIINRFISSSDPRTAFLFGDGAAALLIGRGDAEEFQDSWFYSNYDFFDLAKGYSIKNLEREVLNNDRTDLLYNCYELGNWKDSAGFYEEATDEVVKKLLTDNGLTVEDVDYFLITETNKPLRDRIVSRLGIKEEQTLSLLETRGNTMSAMLPMLYHELSEQKLLKQDKTLLFLSHGEGASGGGILYKLKGDK